ncbi:MAG: addiction module antitoxin [SAR324 cluster bacterium]|nr:addiction module antitoxin [SAR324 cluster bacterium]
MQKKLTISIDEQVYHGLHQVIGPGKISKFIEKLVKPHVLVQDLEAAYKEMSEDKEREDEATEWSEALIGDLDR